MDAALTSAERVGVNAILGLKGADRSAISYAFLYAAFKRAEISNAPVRDALDCLTPFLVPYLQEIAGSQIDLTKMQSYLKTRFGFDIPLYALEQLMPAFVASGHAEFQKLTKRYYAKKTSKQFEVLKAELQTDFDAIVERLKVYAASVGITEVPASPTWGDALLGFLKRAEKEPANYKNIKGALVDPNHIEEAVTAAFIKELHEKTPDAFDKVLKIFMGVLIEEFISSFSEVSLFKSTARPVVYYDTPVLLRILGSSGLLLRTATEELNRYLQDLGIQTLYFSGNESEAAHIFDALIFAKDSGKEIEGETAQAISNNEITITDIRMMRASFVEMLGAKSIFPAEKFEKSAQSLAKYQIDEAAFSGFLLQQAIKAKRPYGEQNRTNDAGYLGTVMRLRAGSRTRDLAECRHLFITTNTFLSSVSRRYLTSNKVLAPQHCPPILSVGQVATIAWLMKDRVLAPEKAGRELLANCFAAVSPDALWFKHFREGIEKAGGSLEAATGDGSAGLVMHAARRIAQEQSFGDASLVRTLNMAEILSRAEDQVRNLSTEMRQEAEVRIQRAEQEAKQRISALEQAQHDREIQLQQEKVKFAENAASAAKEATQGAIASNNKKRANRMAGTVISAIRWLWTVAFLGASIFVWWYQAGNTTTAASNLLALLLVVLGTIGFLDMVGMPVAIRFLRYLRGMIEARIEKFLNQD